MSEAHYFPSRKEPQRTYRSVVLNIRKFLLMEELADQMNRNSNTTKSEVVKVEK